MEGKKKQSKETSRKINKTDSARQVEQMIKEENARLFQQLFCTETRPAKQSFLT